MKTSRRCDIKGCCDTADYHPVVPAAQEGLSELRLDVALCRKHRPREAGKAVSFDATSQIQRAQKEHAKKYGRS